MRYIHIARDKWLDTQPEPMHSHDADSQGNALLDAREYPRQYRGADSDIDKGKYRKELKHGFYPIVLSATNPNIITRALT